MDVDNANHSLDLTFFNNMQTSYMWYLENITCKGCTNANVFPSHSCRRGIIEPLFGAQILEFWNHRKITLLPCSNS